MGQSYECEHKPDWIADCSPPEGIVDVWCGKCGLSGSVRIEESDINWE